MSRSPDDLMTNEADPGEIPNAGAFVKYAAMTGRSDVIPVETLDNIRAALKACEQPTVKGEDGRMYYPVTKFHFGGDWEIEQESMPAIDIGRDVRNAAQRCILATGKEAKRLYLGRRQIAAIEEQGRHCGLARDARFSGKRSEYCGLPVFQVDADDHCEAGL